MLICLLCNCGCDYCDISLPKLIIAIIMIFGFVKILKKIDEYI